MKITKMANSSNLVVFDKIPRSSVDVEIYILVFVNHADFVDDSTYPLYLNLVQVCWLMIASPNIKMAFKKEWSCCCDMFPRDLGL